MFYSSQVARSFTDSSGLVVGDEKNNYWDAGGEARLSWLIPYAGLTWRPYISGTIDQEFGYVNSVDFPAQGVLPRLHFILAARKRSSAQNSDCIPRARAASLLDWVALIKSARNTAYLVDRHP
jgi:hypothetical protein